MSKRWSRRRGKLLRATAGKKKRADFSTNEGGREEKLEELGRGVTEKRAKISRGRAKSAVGIIEGGSPGLSDEKTPLGEREGNKGRDDAQVGIRRGNFNPRERLIQNVGGPRG